MPEIERVTYLDEEEWLKARLEDITSTQVSALPQINLSPYQTPFDLWHEKKNREIVDVPVNERMKWGTRLQDAVARGVAEDLGLTVRRMNAYLRKPVFRIGSSFDFEIVGHKRGPGLMEIKCVDGLVFRNAWLVKEDGTVDAPPHIEMQLQHQLEVSERTWGMIVALVGGNEVYVLERERDDEIGNVIRFSSMEFWKSIEANRPPEPDYSRDAKLIARIYRTTDPGKILDATMDSTLSYLAGQYDFASREVKAHEAAKDAARAKILEAIGPAEKVIGDGWTISSKEVAPNPGTLITPEMVGTYYGGKSGFRSFRLTMKKGVPA